MTTRGASFNPTNRFEQISFVRDEEISDEDYPDAKTVFYKDTSKSIISYNDSPDIFFNASINPYRGCEHGCVYCYARPTHEYFGLSSGIDFESMIFVKTDAALLLQKEMSAKKWTPQVVVMSGVTDCYQPFERRFQITRQCLKVLNDFQNPVGIITKNNLVTRDVDILKDMASWQGACVTITVTTLDPLLARRMEPRASTPANRLKAIEVLSKAGIPVTVNVAPIIPGLTDQEIPNILKAAAQAGAINAGYTIIRLPYALKDLFSQWLSEHYPHHKEKVLNRIKEMRGGVLYKSEFGRRMKGEGIFASTISDIFEMGCKKVGFPKKAITLKTQMFHNPKNLQYSLSF